MPNLDADAITAAAPGLMDRERAVGLALEPHGLTLVIYPGWPASYYDIARAGDHNCVKARFSDIGQAERFTASLPAAPAARPGHTGEWRETCPRCDHTLTDATEPEMLRRLLDHITYEHLIPARRDTDPESTAPGYHGMIRIEWPPANQATPYTALQARETAVTDAVTGEPISTVSSITVHADADGQVTAELTMLADQDGQPDTIGLPVPVGAGYRQGVFTYVVNEMTVRETPAA